MIGGKMLPAKFPKRRVQIAHVDHIAARFADLYSIANLERHLYKYVDPTEKTRDQRLQGQAEHERDQSQRNDSRVPIGKDQRETDKNNDQTDDEIDDTIEVVASGAIAEPFDQIDLDYFYGGQQENDSYRTQGQILQKRQVPSAEIERGEIENFEAQEE